MEKMEDGGGGASVFSELGFQIDPLPPEAQDGGTMYKRTITKKLDALENAVVPPAKARTTNHVCLR